MLLARDFREIARDALRGRWGLAVITGLVAVSSWYFHQRQ